LSRARHQPPWMNTSTGAPAAEGAGKTSSVSAAGPVGRSSSQSRPLTRERRRVGPARQDRGDARVRVRGCCTAPRARRGPRSLPASLPPPGGFRTMLNCCVLWGRSSAGRASRSQGLAQRLVEVIKAPIETKIIEEVKPPPPPPPENLPPPPKFAPPPPSFVPPPEVNVQPAADAGADDHHDQVAPPPAPGDDRAAAGAAGAAGTARAAAPPRRPPARPSPTCGLRADGRRLPARRAARRGHRHHPHPLHVGADGKLSRPRSSSPPAPRASTALLDRVA
jgi:periplasmic protein TonB